MQRSHEDPVEPHVALHAATLVFRDRELEALFSADYGRTTFRQTRIALAATIVLCLLLAAPVHAGAGGWAGPAWIVPAAVGALLALVLVLADEGRYVRHHQLILAHVLVILSAGSVLGLIAAPADVATVVSAGIVLLLFASFAVFPIRFVHAASASAALVLAVLGSLRIAHAAALPEIALHGAFLLTAGLTAGFAGYVIERHRRAAFLQRRRL